MFRNINLPRGKSLSKTCRKKTFDTNTSAGLREAARQLSSYRDIEVNRSLFAGIFRIHWDKFSCGAQSEKKLPGMMPFSVQLADFSGRSLQNSLREKKSCVEKSENHPGNLRFQVEK